MTRGIYKIENLLNGKIYIGQSIQIEKRFEQHKKTAYARKDRNYNNLIYKAIRKYGLENFAFEIIEEVPDNQDLDEREIYWISYYNSYKNGYNMTPGGGCLRGEDSPNTKANRDTVIQVRTLYNAHIKKSEIYDLVKDKLTQSQFEHIWRFETWKDVMPEVNTKENKEFYFHQRGGQRQGGNDARKLSQEEIDYIIYLRDKEKLTWKEIAEKTGRCQATCHKYYKNPQVIKKAHASKRVKCIETGEIFDSIQEAASWAGITSSTLCSSISRGCRGGVKDGISLHWERLD